MTVDLFHTKILPGDNIQMKNLEKIVLDFLKKAKNFGSRLEEQSLKDVFDLQHGVNLSSLRLRAQLGNDYVADWARRAVKEPDQVYKEILKRFGKLPIHKPWEIFAKIYDEDTPDYLTDGVARFVDRVFRRDGINKSDLVIDVACGTGPLARLLTNLRYRKIIAFDKSRQMLSEAYRLCAYLPSIKIMESAIETVRFNQQAKGMLWVGYSTNYSMNNKDLLQKIRNMIDNLEKGGCLIFDIRTKTGWQVDFYKQKITIYETNNFQKIWINLPDYKRNQIHFDIFIRIKDKNRGWLPWEREQMIEKMWSSHEVKGLLQLLDDVEIENIYSDDFRKISSGESDPNLVYFVLRKK